MCSSKSSGAEKFTPRVISILLEVNNVCRHSSHTLRSDYPSAHTGGKQLIVKHYAANLTSKCSTIQENFSAQRVTTCYTSNTCIGWTDVMFSQTHHTWTTVAAASADLMPQNTHNLWRHSTISWADPTTHQQQTHDRQSGVGTQKRTARIEPTQKHRVCLS